MDVFRLEPPEDGDAQIALDFCDGEWSFGFAPEGKQELYRGGANVLHMGVDASMGNNFRVGVGCFAEDLHGLFDRGV